MLRVNNTLTTGDSGLILERKLETRHKEANTIFFGAAKKLQNIFGIGVGFNKNKDHKLDIIV